MASFLHFQGTGEYTNTQKTGIFEVEISITDKAPSSSQIESKTFSSIWKDTFHLNVKNGLFEQTLGSEDNPLPNSIATFTKLWIVVTDQFAPIGSLFEFQVPESMRTESKKTKSSYTKTDSKPNVSRKSGPQGDKGSPGPQGEQGDKGDKGDKGPAGSKLSLIHI